MSRIVIAFAKLTLLSLLAGLSLMSAAQLEINGGSPHLCAVVEGSGTANGTPVISYSCSGGFQDRWNYVFGQLQGIGTANGKTMCLDVKDNGTSPGTLVQLYACNGGLNQQWQIVDGEIYGVQSGACLDGLAGPSSGGGKQLEINTCNNSTGQNWIVRSAEIELSADAPFLCAHVSGADTASGTPVISYSCNGAPAQLWNYIGSQGQIQGIGTANGKSTCLSAAYASPGAPVTLSSCNGGADQAWGITNSTDFGSGYPSASQIALLETELCLDSSGGISVGGGTQLVLNTCTGAASQNWLVH